MRLLLDPHIIVWLMLDPKRLSPTLQLLISEAETRFISAVTAAEVAIKERKLGQKFEFSLQHLALAQEVLVCEELPLLIRHSRFISRIPQLHRDPQDHWLMAQAMSEELILVTQDENICRYQLDSLKIAN